MHAGDTEAMADDGVRPGTPRRPRGHRGLVVAIVALSVLTVLGGVGVVAARHLRSGRTTVSSSDAHVGADASTRPATGPTGAPTGSSPDPTGPPPTPTQDWHVTSPAGTSIEGYADRTSVRSGGQVQLRVRATGTSFHVSVFRMGSYGASQAALVRREGPFPVVTQPPPTELPDTRTVTTSWTPTAALTADGWPPGAYLMRLEGDDGAQGYVPLTVRSDSTAGTVVLVQAVTTWQAYNLYGGLNLYQGKDGRMAERSLAVSFDRPYSEQSGAGDFLSNELPLISFAEHLGIPLAYATDVDLHEDPHLLDGARAVVSPGHDEYYSTAMRGALARARDAGTNLDFLGANAVYRHIRFAGTPLGADRLEIDYKSPADPVTATDPSESTTQWRSAPVSRPESELVGGFYQCNPVKAPLVVAPRLSWLTEGLGLQAGQRLGTLVGTEYDRVDLTVPTPHPLEVLFHSPLTCKLMGSTIQDAADVTYYTTSSGAGVFDAGTSTWVCALDDTACGPGWGDPATYQVVRQVTQRLLTEGAAGPLGRTHPAVDTTGGPPGRDDGIAGIH